VNTTTIDPDVHRFRQELARRQPSRTPSLGRGSLPEHNVNVLRSDDPPAPVLDHLNRLARWFAGVYDDQPPGQRT